MGIRVEFFGIARQRAGVAAVELDLPAAGATLADVLAELARCFPQFGRECVAGGRLHPTLSANLGGEQFVTDPATPIDRGQCLLILSADAGG